LSALILTRVLGMKSEIIEQLGHDDLLLPLRIAEGLAANDRVKLRLSALQAAACHARDPGGEKFALAEECRSVGIDPAAIETLVSHATLSSNGRVTAPGLGDLGRAIWEDVATMAAAVKAADAAQGENALARLSAMKGAVSFGPQDDIEVAQVARLASVTDQHGDSLHRLIMDLHTALNELAASHAESVIAGAHVYGLLPEDRPAVEAFMRGLDSTKRLKFGHPGLATTAGRNGARFTIQNDIGETDAHVVVIAVEPRTVTVTYSDVHLARAKFFTGLLRSFDVQWSGLERKSLVGLAEGGIFYLITGRCTVETAERRDSFLETIGASLVFLIDWNKARKVLRTWVSKGDAVQILDWAARLRFGHRGFLELGGSELVSAAVRHAVPARIGFGEQLDRALGREGAVDFLKTVLRVSAEALLAGGSVRPARDRIEADLVRHLQRVETKLLAVVVRQAGLAREIAAALARFIAARRGSRPFDCTELVKRTRHIEEKADRIATEARSEIARLDADHSIISLVNLVEDAIDELEQAAFVASLVPSVLAPELSGALDELCAAVVSGTEAAAMGVAAAAEVPEGHRIDSEEALASTARLIDAEHAADAAERKVTAKLLSGAFDLKTALSVLEFARAMERATDRLAGFGHVLREHVLSDLAA
jgi:uncharacterized protein Yka (UPF0111/DUF47 family)